MLLFGYFQQDKCKIEFELNWNKIEFLIFETYEWTFAVPIFWDIFWGTYIPIGFQHSLSQVFFHWKLANFVEMLASTPVRCKETSEYQVS